MRKGLLLSVFCLTTMVAAVSQDRVGIGILAPQGKLHIYSNSTIPFPQLRITEDENDFARIKMENTAFPNAYWDIAGKSDDNAAFSRLNFYFNSPGSSGDRMTIMGNGNIGIGTTSPGNKLRVHGSTTSTQHVISASTNYSGFVDIRAIEGFSTPAPGYGTGGYMVGGKYGLYGFGQGGASTGQVYGVYGLATASTLIGTRIGVYGSASGGTKNWGGYFAGGNVFVTNDLRIGTGAENGVTGYKVAIDGKVIAEEMRVQLSGAWPDYVFNEEYELMSLNKLEKEIAKHGHLPGMPSAKEAESEGIMVGDMNRMLLEKVEEMILHIIELNKRIEFLETKNEKK
jgi:hypothetical protein